MGSASASHCSRVTTEQETGEHPMLAAGQQQRFVVLCFMFCRRNKLHYLPVALFTSVKSTLVCYLRDRRTATLHTFVRWKSVYVHVHVWCELLSIAVEAYRRVYIFVLMVFPWRTPQVSCSSEESCGGCVESDGPPARTDRCNR